MSSDATTGDMTEVADMESLRDDGRTVTMAGGRPVALFHHEGEVYAVDNRCPHMGSPSRKAASRTAC